MILFGATAFIDLGILAGAFPIRFQRDDLSNGGFALGIVYIGLAVIGTVSILFALRSATQGRVVHEAIGSTLTMTSMTFATILSASILVRVLSVWAAMSASPTS